jgi:hypothetical protein
VTKEPVELPRAGSFVTEVGLSQTGLFLTFCDNEPTPPEYVRLFLDTGWTLGATRFDLDADEPESGLLTLCRVMSRTVAGAARSGAGLVVEFEDFDKLEIDGHAAANTTHDIWWLARP